MQCVFCEVLIQFLYINNTTVSLHSARSSWLLWTFRVKKPLCCTSRLRELLRRVPQKNMTHVDELWGSTDISGALTQFTPSVYQLPVLSLYSDITVMKIQPGYVLTVHSRQHLMFVLHIVAAMPNILCR